MRTLRSINWQHLLTDLIFCCLTFYLSLFLRIAIDDPQILIFLPKMTALLPYVIFFRLICFLYFQTYNIIWRYVSAVDAFRLAKAVAASSILIIITSLFFQQNTLPRSIYFIDSFLLITSLSSLRLSRRLFHEYQSAKQIQKFGTRTLIYGAGVTGQGILKRLQADQDLRLFVIGFIDDDKSKIGKSISGYKVLGSGDELSQIISNYEIKQVTISIPNLSPEKLKQIIATCSQYQIKPLILASAPGDSENQTLRTVELKDLLLRSPRSIDLTSTKEMITGKRVLITGAGGSIGSELARQVFSFNPARIILLDHSEFNLYNIDQELRSSEDYEARVVPCMIDLKNSMSLAHAFSLYQPEIVIHAAAYKHVHLVESNPHSAIINNILGTKNLLDLCEKHNTEHFVLVSTDKAVNPAGIMGSTKRVCEILLSIYAEKTGRPYCAVRFGNVLGSSGSLIPILQKQIDSGQPLTITHPDVQRYFMLIEEAVSLVLKAASISKSGDINVLRMGEPIKIVDIAKSLIQLLGKTEDEVKIKFTGLRPGEKMFEELYLSGSELSTEHPDILVLPERTNTNSSGSNAEILELINQMIDLATRSDNKSIYLLSHLVNSNYEHPTYTGQLHKMRTNSQNE